VSVTPARPSKPHLAPSVDPTELLAMAQDVFTGMFQLEQLVAADDRRALFVARHDVLERRVALRVHFRPGTPGRHWFERETVLLARLDHQGIRPVHSAGYRGDWAYRVSKWIDGESLFDAVARGPRPLPEVLQIARDLLGALDYAHSEGVVVRRIVPTGVMLTRAGRAIITDLRWSNPLLPFAAPDVDGTAEAFLAPEARAGRPGDPGSDVYAAAAVLYFAVTAEYPPTNPLEIPPPSTLRPTCPRALERVITHALHADPSRRYLTVEEMGEDLLSELGEFEFETSTMPAAVDAEADPEKWEKLLRRALGDDYELLSLLGTGAFGRVYRARDLALEREVALKVLHPSLLRDRSVVERFGREAQLAAQVRHPHIVDVFDTGGRGGLLWYTMAYVPGENLGQHVRRVGPLSVDRALEIMRQGLSALAHAHNQGLVHRDLKPENILIEPGGRIQITDFGLALALEGSDDRRHASHSGTPEFAAPEQLLGESVDYRADLYSLTMVMIYALTARLPFGGGSVESVLARQTTGRLPDLAASRSDIPDELIRVLERGAARDPADRFDSAEAYAKALEDAVRRWRGSPMRVIRRMFGGE
jgi:serine/threonine-protein kinase